MTKTEKKTEQLLIKQLTNACEELKLHIDSFEYLTHHGQLSKLKQTLKVEVFCTAACSGQQLKKALSVINTELKTLQLTLKPHDLIMTVIAD